MNSNRRSGGESQARVDEGLQDFQWATAAESSTFFLFIEPFLCSPKVKVPSGFATATPDKRERAPPVSAMLVRLWRARRGTMGMNLPMAVLFGLFKAFGLSLRSLRYIFFCPLEILKALSMIPAADRTGICAGVKTELPNMSILMKESPGMEAIAVRPGATSSRHIKSFYDFIRKEKRR